MGWEWDVSRWKFEELTSNIEGACDGDERSAGDFIGA